MPSWTDSAWFEPLDDRRDRPTLLAFPFSGTGVATFAPWRTRVPDDLSLVAVRLPGRETRLEEPPATDMIEVARTVAEAIVVGPSPPPSVIPVGFSGGAILAYETAAALIDRGVAVPLLVVASQFQPQSHDGSGVTHRQPDEEFLRQIDQTYDAVPDAMRENDELRELLLPTLKADIGMNERYVHPDRGPLPCDVLVMTGEADRVIDLRTSDGWTRVGRDARRRIFPGGHFFLKNQPDAVLDAIVHRYRTVI